MRACSNHKRAPNRTQCVCAYVYGWGYMGTWGQIWINLESRNGWKWAVSCKNCNH